MGLISRVSSRTYRHDLPKMSGVEELTLENDINRAIELLNVLQKNPQLPTEKLDALKRILTSDFFQSVREVYERVYDAAQLEGVSTEVAASATAKATVAAFA